MPDTALPSGPYRVEQATQRGRLSSPIAVFAVVRDVTVVQPQRVAESATLEDAERIAALLNANENANEGEPSNV